MTRILFDKNGKPSWINVDTAKFMHEMVRLQNPCQFTDVDMQWFRKPLERSE